MPSESVRFDSLSRCSLSDQPVPPGGVLRAIRDSAESAGLDPVAELYNEALRFANEGHLRFARERLSILLAFSPSDGDARLLLAKVWVAGQRWRDALAALDEAQAAGANVPQALRSAVEQNLRQSEADAQIQAGHVHARDVGEAKALRQEARRLRSENAQLIGRNHDLEYETRKWALTAAGVSIFAMLFIVGNLLFGGEEMAVTPPVEQVVQTTVAPEPVLPAPPTEPLAAIAPPEVAPPEVAPPPAAPPTNQEMAREITDTLRTKSGLHGITGVEVDGSSATLSGTVDTYLLHKRAVATAGSVNGIDQVDGSGVTVNARSGGMTHVVTSGDTLGQIALNYYGEITLAADILQANSSVLGGKTNLSIGQELIIPPVE